MPPLHTRSVVEPDEPDLMPPEWPPGVGLALDVAALALAAVVGDLVGSQRTPDYRPVVVLVFALVVPGWAIVRAFRARATSLTLFASIGLSVCIQLVLGEILVARADWSWRPAFVALASVSAALSLIGFGRATYELGRAHRAKSI